MRLGATSSPERAVFGALISFAITIPTSRTINYVRERRRTAPLLRSLTRRVRGGPHNSAVRVHHFLPGVAIVLAAGGGAILTHERRAFWLSMPFGVGTALTFDELEVMLGRDNPYWGGERFALTQSGVAALAAAALLLRFHLRGTAHTAD